MKDSLEGLLEEAKASLALLEKRSDWEAGKARFLGPNGSLTALMKGLGQLPKEERPAAGQAINGVKREVEALFVEALAGIEAKEVAAKLGQPVDPTLPTVEGRAGGRHPLTQIRLEIVGILGKLGFQVIEGTEIETEHYAFDALNTPAHHPARAEQDTYYFPEDLAVSNVSKKGQERYLLRPHTSSMQIRTMLAQEPPIRMISPGRCFRRDTADATHSANFHQLEGLAVDKNVTVRDLKGVLDTLFRELLGKDAKIRFRPHFFPYTEPSFEVDFSSSHLRKLGKEWVEIMGCGMVDPTVFASVGYDPEVYSGFAFGMGLERIAMILHGIDDIRYFYTNDWRFLNQFA